MLIDTHAHLDFPEFQDLEAVLKRAEAAGVGEIVSIGIDEASSRRAVELSLAHRRIHATVGIHPHGARSLGGKERDALEKLARGESVVAVGEIGLDYYRDRRPRDIQKECFCGQLDLACKLSLPPVFHVRDAFPDFLDIVKEYSSRLPGGVVHCFSGDWPAAVRCLDLGFHLSVPGTVTFANAASQQDVVRRMPLDRLLLETDAPFLAPVPHRGKANEPAYVVHTARKVAELRGLSLEEVARETTSNAKRVFGLEGGKNV